MSTQIQWTDNTFNCITGCTRVSEGCRFCYAEKLSASRLRLTEKYKGVAEFTGAGPKWTGQIRLHPEMLTSPLTWRPRPSRKNPDGRWMVFVNDMSDTFHEQVPFPFLDKLFAMFALTPHVIWQVLTKRPERMAEYLDMSTDNREEDIGREALRMSKGEHDGILYLPLSNVWLGTSVEDQETANERIPLLLACPAAVRFVSYEPALGPLDFQSMIANRQSKIHWIIVGGESGAKARPFEMDWGRSTISQCATAGVPCFVKQIGSEPQEWDKAAGGSYPVRDSHGGDITEWPRDLRVRQWPTNGDGATP